MDIMELGAIGELVGGLAVIGSLIFVGLQVRQNTASFDTARYETITTGFNDIDATVVNDPDLAHLFNQGLADPDSLNPQQEARVAFVLRMFHNQYYKIFRLHRTGVLPKGEWSIYARQCAQLFGSPGGQRYLVGNPDYPALVEAVSSYDSEERSFEFGLGVRDRPQDRPEDGTS